MYAEYSNSLGQKIDWGEGKMDSYCLTGTEFQLGKMKKFWKWILVMVAQQCGST